MSREIAYRPDIDGLRAVAVSAVVVFHVFDALGGGFLGVDIFFVISGFLITGILVRECEERRFSLLRFYERRIRRILPALCVVLAFTMIVAAVILLPADLIGLARGVLATLTFVSNIYFWRDTDYFSPAADTKALLHTWSLGIEEQFYIFFPLMLALAFRFGRRTAFLTTIIVTIASLLLAVAVIQAGKGTVAFYLLPMRAWELGAGAIVSFIPRAPARQWQANAAAFAGVVLVVLLIFERDVYRYMPMPLALPAVVGTALLIWAGARPNPISRILGSPPFVTVGLLSYSLYLWHWPLNVFLHYYLIREPVFAEQVAVLLSTIVAAWLSLRYVETPFRTREMPIRRVLAIVGIAVAALAAGAIVLIAARGLPARLPARAAQFNRVAGTNYRCPPTSYLRFGAVYACPINLRSGNAGDAEIALVGDSFAQMYLPTIEPELARLQLGGVLLPANGCLPFTTVNAVTSCIDLFRANIDAVLASRSIRLVILAASWERLEQPLVDSRGRAFTGDGWAAGRPDLERTIAVLERAGKHVAIVSPIATPGYDLASVVSREIAFGRPLSRLAMSRAEFDRRFGRIWAWGSARPMGASFVDVTNVLCDAARCRFATKDGPVFADGGHISVYHAGLFAPSFKAVLDDYASRRGRPIEAPRR